MCSIFLISRVCSISHSHWCGQLCSNCHIPPSVLLHGAQVILHLSCHIPLLSYSTMSKWSYISLVTYHYCPTLPCPSDSTPHLSCKHPISHKWLQGHQLHWDLQTWGASSQTLEGETPLLWCTVFLGVLCRLQDAKFQSFGMQSSYDLT